MSEPPRKLKISDIPEYLAEQKRNREIREQAQPSYIVRHRKTGILFDFGKMRIVGLRVEKPDKRG